MATELPREELCRNTDHEPRSRTGTKHTAPTHARCGQVRPQQTSVSQQLLATVCGAASPRSIAAMSTAWLREPWHGLRSNRILRGKALDAAGLEHRRAVSGLHQLHSPLRDGVLIVRRRRPQTALCTHRTCEVARGSPERSAGRVRAAVASPPSAAVHARGWEAPACARGGGCSRRPLVTPRCDDAATREAMNA